MKNYKNIKNELTGMNKRTGMNDVDYKYCGMQTMLAYGIDPDKNLFYPIQFTTALEANGYDVKPSTLWIANVMEHGDGCAEGCDCILNFPYKTCVSKTKEEVTAYAEETVKRNLGKRALFIDSIFELETTTAAMWMLKAGFSTTMKDSPKMRFIPKRKTITVGQFVDHYVDKDKDYLLYTRGHVMAMRGGTLTDTAGVSRAVRLEGVYEVSKK